LFNQPALLKILQIKPVWSPQVNFVIVGAELYIDQTLTLPVTQPTEIIMSTAVYHLCSEGGTVFSSAGCLQLLEIYWNFKTFLEILEIYWNFVILVQKRGRLLLRVNKCIEQEIFV